MVAFFFSLIVKEFTIRISSRIMSYCTHFGCFHKPEQRLHAEWVIDKEVRLCDVSLNYVSLMLFREQSRVLVFVLPTADFSFAPTKITSYLVR